MAGGSSHPTPPQSWVGTERGRGVMLAPPAHLSHCWMGWGSPIFPPWLPAGIGGHKGGILSTQIFAPAANPSTLSHCGTFVPSATPQALSRFILGCMGCHVHTGGFTWRIFSPAAPWVCPCPEFPKTGNSQALEATQGPSGDRQGHVVPAHVCAKAWHHLPKMFWVLPELPVLAPAAKKFFSRQGFTFLGATGRILRGTG